MSVYNRHFFYNEMMRTLAEAKVKIYQIRDTGQKNDKDQSMLDWDLGPEKQSEVDGIKAQAINDLDDVVALAQTAIQTAKDNGFMMPDDTYSADDLDKKYQKDLKTLEAL